MNSVTMATNLLRGGFAIEDAANILLWMAAHYRYDRVQSLADLEDIALDMTNEELWVPQPWLGELRYRRRQGKRRDNL